METREPLIRSAKDLAKAREVFERPSKQPKPRYGHRRAVAGVLAAALAFGATDLATGGAAHRFVEGFWQRKNDYEQPFIQGKFKVKIRPLPESTALPFRTQADRTYGIEVDPSLLGIDLSQPLEAQLVTGSIYPGESPAQPFSLDQENAIEIRKNKWITLLNNIKKGGTPLPDSWINAITNFNNFENETLNKRRGLWIEIDLSNPIKVNSKEINRVYISLYEAVPLSYVANNTSPAFASSRLGLASRRPEQGFHPISRPNLLKVR